MINATTLSEFAKNLTLLCVEDDMVTQRRLELYFSKTFKEVHVANNGYEGLEKFIKHNPDIVITDIEMPSLNGLDMTYKIKELKPATKVLVISAHDDKDYLMRSLNIGVDGYITKPIQNNQMMDNINKILKHLAILKNIQISKTNILDDIKTNVNFCDGDDQKKFIEALHITKTNELTIKVLNIYKGLVLSHDNTILEITKNKLSIICTKSQALISKIATNVVLHTDLFPKSVSADIIGIKESNGKFILDLDNFIHFEDSLIQRKDVRLIPKENFLVKLFFKGKAYSVEIVDISAKAFSLKNDVLSNLFSVDDEMELKLHLPKEYKTNYNSSSLSILIGCKGTIYKIDNSGNIIIFITYKNQSDQKEVVDYLINRQKELISELRSKLTSI